MESLHLLIFKPDLESGRLFQEQCPRQPKQKTLIPEMVRRVEQKNQAKHDAATYKRNALNSPTDQSGNDGHEHRDEPDGRYNE
jgi:hypothetical protein